METVDVTFEGVRYCTNLSDTYRAEDFYHMVYYATTGPVAFQHVIDIIVSGENDWWTSNGNEPVAHADFDSMSFAYKGIDINLLSISPTPPELPRFTDALERAWSEGVEIQEDYFDPESNEADSSAYGVVFSEPAAKSHDKKVNVITSRERNKTNRHRFILDLDCEASLIPTSTPGHYHLFVDKTMTAVQYGQILNALHEAGVIADGNMSQWMIHGTQFLRLPTVRKAGKNAPKDQSR